MKIYAGVCIATIVRGVIYQVHTPVVSLNARPCPNPWDSGPIQWARGGVGLKPSAAARPGWGTGSGGVIVDPRMRGQEGCTRDISISQQGYW